MTTIGTSTTINIGRALMASMQPLTGLRAAGILKLTAKAGTVITIPRNQYFMPVIDGQRMTSWLFKATDGPNEDNSWTINDSGNSLITVMSNIGGSRHNVDAGTVFIPGTPIDGLEIVGAEAIVATEDFAGGKNDTDFGGVQDMALYQSFDGPAMGLDLHRSPIDQFPAVLVAFQDMTPADGVAIAQNNQMAINAGTDQKMYKWSYTITVFTEIGEGDSLRRNEGLLIADTIMQLLNDKHEADPGECLSNPGGVQVRQMIPEQGPQDIYKHFYVYTVLVSAMGLLERLDFRVFQPWLRTTMAVDKPQLPVLPNQGTIRLLDDVVIDMTPSTLDLGVDGVFVRATAANMWIPSDEASPGQLLSYGANERRVTNLALGVLMEPTTSGDLGAQGEDLTGSGWSAAGGATVQADQETDPAGVMDSADQVTFLADADSHILYSDASVTTVGVPNVLQVFAKAPGNKFTTRMRLGVVDSTAVEHLSDDIEVGPNWALYRFEVTLDTAGSIEIRLHNASDGVARAVMFWGVNWNQVTNFWGAEYTLLGASKAQDRLSFFNSQTIDQPSNQITPVSVLSGRWRLRWRSPDDVPADIIGTNTGVPTRTLVSVGDGSTDLMRLTLIGTPMSGGAALAMSTRGDGSVVSIAGLEWVPGAELQFTIDAASGVLTVEGTLNGDGDYAFPAYAEDADTALDLLVIGENVASPSGPVPGRYIAIDYNL